jgi:phosphoribosylformylglycinamidine cyclo-ligase
MNINDLYMCGAFPVYKLQNHVILPEDDHRAVENIVGALVAECKRRRIAVTGGETSVHSNIVGMDISVTMSGMWRGKDNQYQAGDAVVGIPSAGIHANGLTRARQLLGPDRPEWIVPTAIYDSVPEVYFACSACNHITGGGFTKLRHNLPHGVNAVLFDPDSQDMPPLFPELHAAGCTSDEMYRTFNCGWGFLLGCPRQELEGVLRATGGKVIGEITPGNGSIIISSAFDGESVIYPPRP